MSTTRPSGARSGEHTHCSVTSARPGSAQERDLTRRFADAFCADDIDGVVALLTDDAWLAMPPAPHEYRGAAAIASFLRTGATWRGGRRFRLVPTRANTQPAFGCYLPDISQPIAHPAGLIVLTVGHDRILAITRFLHSELLPRFGLPARVVLPSACQRDGVASASSVGGV